MVCKTMNDVKNNLPNQYSAYEPIIKAAMSSSKTRTKHAELLTIAFHGIKVRAARGEKPSQDAITSLGVVFMLHCQELLARGYCPLTNAPHKITALEIN